MSVYISYNVGLRDLTFPFCMLCEQSGSPCVPVNIDDVPFSVVPLSSRQVVCAERFEGTTDIAIWYVSSRISTLSLFLYFI